MTEIVRKRSSKWDVVPDTSIPIEDQHVPGTSIPTEDQHDSNINCEKTGDTMHDKNSNLELSDSKAMKWSNVGNSNLESSGSQAIKWSNVEPKDTTLPKDSAWSNVEPKDTTLPNDSAWTNVEPKDTMLPKDSAWSNVESKDTTLPKDSTWSNVEPKDTTLPKDSAWSSLDVGSENRDGGNILSTTKTWGGGQWSLSPGLDSWSRSHSRSPKRERSRSHRSRSRSPSRSFSHEKDGWNDRRRGNHETYGHDDGRHSSSGPTESRGSRHERGGPTGHVDDDRRQRGYSRDRPFHGERKTQEPDRDNRNPCFDFRKGRCFRGSACKYAHHASSADGYGARSTDEAARERAHDRHDLALPFENRHRHNNRGLPPCKFFAQGQCRKGASCSFPHLAPENENGSLRPADDRWGSRPDNGNNLEGSKNLEWQDKATENAPRSPKWRFDSSKRVGITDLHPPEKFLNSNRDQHAYYMGREQSKQIHEDLPPWNPPETYHTLPNQAPGFPLSTSQQDMTQEVPDSHQFVSNCNTFVTDNSGGVNSSASHLSSMVTGPIPRFNLNEQSQQMGLQAPLNPQFPMQTGTGDRVTKPDINDSNSIQITAEAAIAQNLVTSEQVSQVKNISASLAQIFATGQRLPQLYASLNSAVAAPGTMIPSQPFSHPNSMRPLAPMGVEMAQTNTGFWPQSKQYDPISDSIKSDNPPGFALQQNVSTEESVKPTKSLDTLTEAGGFNDNDPKKNSGTEEKGYYNNENHGSGQPEMNRDAEAKQMNEVVAEGEKEPETDHSKETGANVGRIEEESMKSKEAKGMRMFKFALVEFVKEMLKPTWKEGQMSKEAHKTIVKKVVDKVTGTLQGPQIPQTQEKIDHYLLFSKTKLEKLVQAYVEKYLKI